MHISTRLRQALAGLTLVASAVSASATVVYNETFGTAYVDAPFATLTNSFTATGVTYTEYSAGQSNTSGFLLDQASNTDAVTPNIASGANLSIHWVGGGVMVSGIDTSAVVGQPLVFSVSALIGFGFGLDTAELYPFTDGTETARNFIGNLNDYMRFEFSSDNGGTWDVLTLNLNTAIGTASADEPWTQWEANLGSFVGQDLAIRFQDTKLLTEGQLASGWWAPGDSQYTLPIRIDSLAITATAVPEPATFAFGAGFVALMMTVLRRKGRADAQVTTDKSEFAS